MFDGTFGSYTGRNGRGLFVREAKDLFAPSISTGSFL
jgi:hypothetical protein